MRPVVCMVTAPLVPGGEPVLVTQVRRAAEAGVHLVQIRQPQLDGGPLLRLVERCLAAIGGTGARLLVNDRVDVALAAGAHGVHLRHASLPAARVRTMVPPGFLIGRSVHTADEAALVSGDGGLDYLIAGTVFPSASKPGVEGIGVDGLRAVVAATPLPVLAIGGMTMESVRDLAGTGAAGFAAIGMFSAGAAIRFDLPDTAP